MVNITDLSTDQHSYSQFVSGSDAMSASNSAPTPTPTYTSIERTSLDRDKVADCSTEIHHSSGVCEGYLPFHHSTYTSTPVSTYNVPVDAQGS